MNKDLISYYLIRTLSFPFMFLPYRAIHLMGKFLGNIAYLLLKNYRKTALSNLALAKNLNLSFSQIKKIARQSFQNLAINILEYARFSREKNFLNIIQCKNPKITDDLYNKGQGIIFFCGHQSNWEALFLNGTSRMRGTAIGKPIYNRKLYDWILSIREKNGGKIIDPKTAMLQGIKDLKKGIFLGIVGDQGMPNSNYSFPFLGRKAWTSLAPALISYKTKCPIVVATTERTFGGYQITLSNPIWPNSNNPAKKEVPHLMDQTLKIFEKSVEENPGEWLWQHNRWKQQLPGTVLKKYRHESICIILPNKKKEFDNILPHLPTLKKIYPQNFLFLLVPAIYKEQKWIDCEEIIYYEDTKELFRKDFRFKMVLDFTNNKNVKKHYMRLSALSVLSIEDLQKITQEKLAAQETQDLSKILIHALCRPKAAQTLINELKINA